MVKIASPVRLKPANNRVATLPKSKANSLRIRPIVPIISNVNAIIFIRVLDSLNLELPRYPSLQCGGMLTYSP